MKHRKSKRPQSKYDKKATDEFNEALNDSDKKLKVTNNVPTSMVHYYFILSRLKAMRTSIGKKTAVSPKFEAQAIEHMQKLAKDENWDAVSDEEILQEATMLWARLRNARIFDMGKNTYAQLYIGADIHTTENIAKVKYTQQSEYVPEKETKKHFKAVTEAGRTHPFPEHLPFDYCYFSYGSGIHLSDTQIFSRLGPSAPAIMDQITELSLVAHLVCWDGFVWQLFKGTLADTGEPTSFYRCNRAGYEWERAYSLDPWIISALVRLVNDNVSVLEKPSFSQRRMASNVAKKFGFKKAQPKPYYPVFLDREIVNKGFEDTTREGSKVARHLDWRHDVRGHWRLPPPKRGPLPLDKDTLGNLKDRGYTVITDGVMPRDVVEHFATRKYPLRKEGEWLAWKLTWIKEHISPTNPDLPYVPARRLLSKHS